MIYLVGSLKNPRIPEIAAEIRTWGYEVFDDWHGAGLEADRYWQEHYQRRGFTMRDALQQALPQSALNMDRSNIDRSSAGILIMPAGKSGFSELGRMNGQGKPTFVLMEEGDPEKWDLMLGLFTGIAYNLPELQNLVERYCYA